jgi:uncharacterized protein
LKLHLLSGSTHKMFTAHGAGYVAVNGERHTRALVVTPDQVLNDWQPQGFEALEQAHFDYFLALDPEVVLLGTGAKQRFPHPQLIRALTAKGIGVECMDTPAACRTYNILMAEDRKVVAAILL